MKRYTQNITLFILHFKVITEKMRLALINCNAYHNNESTRLLLIKC